MTDQCYKMYRRYHVRKDRMVQRPCLRCGKLQIKMVPQGGWQDILQERSRARGYHAPSPLRTHTVPNYKHQGVQTQQDEDDFGGTHGRKTRIRRETQEKVSRSTTHAPSHASYSNIYKFIVATLPLSSTSKPTSLSSGNNATLSSTPLAYQQNWKAW